MAIAGEKASATPQGTTNATGRTIHLFIMSGQSNMNGIKPEMTVRPALQNAFPDDEIVIVKDAADGRSIRLWYKNWKPAAENQAIEHPEEANGFYYDRLIGKVHKTLNGKKPNTVTFLWMQGESDGKAAASGTPYDESLRGVLAQLQKDIGREDINMVIGRINTFGLSRHAQFPDWDNVRLAQVKVAERSNHGAWINVDDLGDDLHYSKESYSVMGTRFAEKAIDLIRRSSPINTTMAPTHQQQAGKQ